MRNRILISKHSSILYLGLFLLLFSCLSKETETLDVSERTENLMLNTSKYAFSMLEKIYLQTNIMRLV